MTTPNASNQKGVKALEKLERRTRMDELNDLSKYVLNTRAGRKYIWNILVMCGVNQLSYHRGDTHETAFREGERNIGNRILADIMDCNAEIYAIMRTE